MSTYQNKIPRHHHKRLEKIAGMLREMRFSEGKCQYELTVSRRAVQRAEYGNNLTLVKLFELIDCYGYSLDEFFQGME